MQHLAHISLLHEVNGTVKLPGSKSESNRALIIDALSGYKCHINNLSEADDTRLLADILRTHNESADCKNAGTTFRFLLAYFSAINKEIILTGSERMKQRPVKPLVEALQELGASIEYLNNEGYPPIKIKKSFGLTGGSISISANVSSQFISALLLIAPTLNNGLKLNLQDKVASRSYIATTLEIMKHFGIDHSWKGNTIEIPHQEYTANEFTVESDWSGASYWYSMVALSDNGAIFLEGLKRQSFQGDSIIKKMMEPFGVITEFTDRGAFLTKGIQDLTKLPSVLDFADCPDLAQTTIVLCAARNVPCRLTGIESLKIKETDRVSALQNELKKFGTELIEESKGVYFIKGKFNSDSSPVIETYDDHRMAMSFAPLAIICKRLSIKFPECVEKSYPGFWQDMAASGFTIDLI